MSDPKLTVLEEQMSVIFGMIATEAATLRRLMLDHCDGENDAFHAGISLVEKIGYMADLGVSKGSGIPARGDAEQWFMPPSYWWPLEQDAESAPGESKATT